MDGCNLSNTVDNLWKVFYIGSNLDQTKGVPSDWLRISVLYNRNNIYEPNANYRFGSSSGSGGYPC